MTTVSRDHVAEYLTHLDLSPEPHALGYQRWRARLPAATRWTRLDDRLVARGWAPKNAVAQLAYGVQGEHEVLIDPTTRAVRIRLSERAARDDEERAWVLAELARALIEAGS